MKLEPVFLLAPEPEPKKPEGWSRRAVLAIALTSFAAGLGAGAVVWPVGEPIDSADLELKWATALARSSIDELVAMNAPFLQVAGARGHRNAAIQAGVLRLADAIRDASLDERRRVAIARALVTVITTLGVDASRELESRLPELRQLAR